MRNDLETEADCLLARRLAWFIGSPNCPAAGESNREELVAGLRFREARLSRKLQPCPLRKANPALAQYRLRFTLRPSRQLGVIEERLKQPRHLLSASKRLAATPKILKSSRPRRHTSSLRRGQLWRKDAQSRQRRCWRLANFGPRIRGTSAIASSPAGREGRRRCLTQARDYSTRQYSGAFGQSFAVFEDERREFHRRVFIARLEPVDADAKLRR